MSQSCWALQFALREGKDVQACTLESVSVCTSYPYISRSPYAYVCLLTLRLRHMHACSSICVAVRSALYLSGNMRVSGLVGGVTGWVVGGRG